MPIEKYGEVIISEKVVLITHFTFNRMVWPEPQMATIAWAKKKLEIAEAELRKEKKDTAHD
jgi:hypothetical protein